MNVAFYAPMKAPDDPRPSGDRTVGRGFLDALRRAGHQVSVPTRFRSWDRGDVSRQERLRQIGGRLAGRLAQRLAAGPERPDIWFTYHLYHKAPDFLGPQVADALGIPYAIAEASVAGKQADGLWDLGYRASIAALERADLVMGLNPNDAAGIAPHCRPDAVRLALSPFVDCAPFVDASGQRAAARAALVTRWQLDPDVPVLLAVAMTRNDQKLASYRLLAEAAARFAEGEAQLVIVGSGPAEAEVRAAFAAVSIKVVFTGAQQHAAMPAIYAACDLYVWPAIKESWSMALVEAQAAGLAVVAGRSGGVANVVVDGETGLLVREGDGAAFADALAAMLDSVRRAAMGRAAQAAMLARHDIGVAACTLDAALRETVAVFAARRAGNAAIEETS